MKPTLLIMAAGMGSRYGGLKQIDPIGPNGEIIMEYSVYDAIRAGFGKVVFVIRKDFADVFKEKIGAKLAGAIEVEYVFQELDMFLGDFQPLPERVKPWGTGHAIMAAKDVIDRPFAVINADDYYGKTSFKVLGDFLSSDTYPSPTEYSMVGFKLRNTLSEHGHVSRGVCDTDGEFYLENVNERTRILKDGNAAKYIDANGDYHPLTGDEVVSMNFWGFQASIFDHLDSRFVDFLKNEGLELKSEYLIPLIVGEMVKEGKAKVKILESPDSWFGVTYKEDKEITMNCIKNLVDSGVYPNNLWG
jgi:hypothetical protein